MANSNVNLEGTALLNDPVHNRSTAFTEEERSTHHLEGLLPAAVDDLPTQLKRVLGHLSAKPTALEQYIYLQDLCDRNETLFYATLMSDPARFVPIVYDPTIADACLTYGHIYRRPQGMYLTKHMKGRFAEVLANWPVKDIRFIYVSSGGRILGLGDIGANGAPIPIGKLQLYTGCAAVPPDCLLPIHLDIGTTNVALRADPLYTGLRDEPPSPDEVDALVDEFMAAANQVFPGVCVHFEDWRGSDAIRLLARYKDRYLVYNDDIQGTASVTIAGLTTALEIKNEKLADQTVLFAGAGSAGIGIADMIVEAMVDEGRSKEDAGKRVTLFDVNGLIEASRKDLNASQAVYARDLKPTRDLAEAVVEVKPTILIGVSTVGGLFTETVIRNMAKNVERPIIFPLSNPTDKAECTPKQAYEWTDGKALVAAGVQFPDVTAGGKTFHPGQANNFYIFPAIGLAVYATRPKRIDDRMFIAAARGSAAQVSQADRDKGMLFPPQDDILETEITTATRERLQGGRSGNFVEKRAALSLRSAERCPPKAKVTRSNRVGCASFFLFCSELCARERESRLSLTPASKQSGERPSPSAGSLAVDVCRSSTADRAQDDRMRDDGFEVGKSEWSIRSGKTLRIAARSGSCLTGSETSGR